MKQLYEYLLSKNKVKNSRTFDNNLLTSFYNAIKSTATCKDDTIIEDMFDNLQFLDKKYDIDKMFDCITNIIHEYTPDGKAEVEVSRSSGRQDKSNTKRYDILFIFENYKIQVSFYEQWAIVGVKFISKYADYTINYERKTTMHIKCAAYWHWTRHISTETTEIASYCIDRWVTLNK